MRIIEVTKAFSLNEISFKEGHKYVMAEDTESQYRSIHGDCLGMSYPIDPSYRPYKGEDLTNKKILTWRTGGVGDIYFVNPVFRHLKKRHPTCFIRVATGCREPLENLPEIDELYKMPFDAKLLDDSDYHLFFQGIIEASSDLSKRTHAVDMFFNYFGIDSLQFPAADKRPRLIFSEEEQIWLKTQLKKMGISDQEYVIGVQLETSSPLRNFPKDKMKAFIDIVAQEEGVKIVLIGSDQQKPLAGFIKGNASNILLGVDFSVRQSIVLAQRYNLIIAPDTFMIQTAGALEKPLIGLYGPFASEVRMAYFKNAIALEPKVVCGPCWKHDFRPCIKGYPSPCFSLVNVEDVLQAIDYQKVKFTGTHFKYMTRFLRDPEFTEVDRYFLSADKGLCFFPGHYKHPNMIRVDMNQFVNPDISDLSSEFPRGSYPFVLYMNDFSQKRVPLYHNCKALVRPGGHFIAYKEDAGEQFFNEIKRDLGTEFTLLYSKLDPVRKQAIIVARRPL